MTFYIDFTGFTGAGPINFIVENWREVGIRAIPRMRTRAFFVTEMTARRQDFLVWAGESEHNPLIAPRSFVASAASGMGIQAFGWAIWFNKGGLDGGELEEDTPWVEPPDNHPMRESMRLLQKARQATTFKAQKRYMDQILQIAAENMWTINIATPPPELAVVSNGFRNVPEVALAGWNYLTPANTGIETFYWENPDVPEAVKVQIRQEIATITLPPNTVSTAGAAVENGNILRSLIKWTILGTLAVGLILVAKRHPFIGRRLLLMVPTLFIISIITFTIIQIPPGDYIDAKKIQAEMTGNQNFHDEVEQLMELFPQEKPIVMQYLKWSGVVWFFTYESSDKGLLQGHLGRSMETRQSVNEMVGDRILLTLLISLGTILFTWAVALPIGIYSAVRQYSPGDYIVTAIGFIGMSIPNFLLALILMYFSATVLGVNISGLFSPEYAARADWTWGKVWDLLSHIWLPIVVLGVSGTAGMIRIMRGNLLDELKKPYVTTARSKGVRPLKLLLKYPVRLALNPFISSIGYIFPQLISGGAIVAMVLSLPTVGPLLLEALLTEDLYLAGSMLMVLSLLAVLGTLVSDLLLLILDPRIRMEGGTTK
jgi:ABC-type dipeptide/oligopeptide/nickel transport system permease component